MKVAIFLVMVAVATASVVKPSITPPRSSGSSNSIRLIGSEEAGDREFPFAVSVQKNLLTGRYEHFCSGAIYDETRIITSAICCIVFGFEMRIVAGAHDLKALTGDEQIIQADSFVIHENFENPLNDNDIGIITLSKPLVFNQRVQPIRMALAGTEPSGEVVTAGWGAIGAQETSVQRKVTLNPINRETCKEDLARIEFGVTDGMVCASAPGKATCENDYGNPLIAKDEAQRPYLAGVASFTFDPCGLDGYHSVFTNIAKHRGWLESKLNP